MAKEVKRRKRYGVKMTRITISIPAGLLELADQAAKEDFTTRSDIIRAALLWYLRPLGRQTQQLDLEKVLETLQNRKLSAALRKMTKDLDPYD